MNKVIEQLLLIIDAQQSLIRRLTRMVSESQSIDDALRAQVIEESAASEQFVRNVLEG